MKKFIVLMVLLIASLSQASLVYPIFDNDRGPWANYLAGQASFPVVETGTMFGLTNPNIGKIPFDIKLEVVIGRVSFDIPNDVPDGINVSLVDGDLCISGIHDGPGNIIDNIALNGMGGLYVWDMNFWDSSLPYEYERDGIFAVVTLPEPTTIILLGLGCLIVRGKK